MPEMNGIEATRYIKENYPRVRIVVLSVLSDPCIVAAVFEAGASAFVWKQLVGLFEECGDTRFHDGTPFGLRRFLF